MLTWMPVLVGLGLCGVLMIVHAAQLGMFRIHNEW